MNNQFVQCWCEESIPPWSAFWIIDLLSPSALTEPIFIVGTLLQHLNTGPGTDATWTKTFHYPSIRDYTKPPGEGMSASWRAWNMRAYGFTNGIANIPAKNVFSAAPLHDGIHWLACLEDDLEALNLYSYYGFNIQAGYGPVNFRRIGRGDSINKCVPVVMDAIDWVVAG